ncbi:hypothetical protein H5P36_23905 [Bacillus sp. APMAM]|nr:hypothetical protein [Bacillus sp. APMAM]RTZ53363.1 hypothetical protein EKO25_23675 [Bacillus sp. SAJ1]
MNLKLFFKLSFLLILFLISIKNPHAYSASIEMPEITSINTAPYEIKKQWVCLPNNKGELHITVTTKNTSKIKIWITPTGTNQWKNRKLLIADNLNNNKYTYRWKYQSDYILNHIVIKVFSSTGEQDSSSFNVINHCK